MDSGFVHLHLHTEFSLLDGAIRIKDLGARLKEMGMTSCAITDHGSMFGCVDFYKEMLANDIHPIIGCEVYVAPDSRFNKDIGPKERAYNHLILLAKNNEGLKNLNRLVSTGYTEGFYRKPRIDKELLIKWHDGLICLSGCLAGRLPELIMEGKFDEAQSEALWFDDLFGRDNYYLEIQSNMMKEQSRVNAALIKISNSTGIPLVATNDCHYLRKEDSSVHDVLLCMQTGTKLSDPSRMKMETDDFYVKSESEIRRFFADIPESVDNTVKIANMCKAEYDFNTIHLPQYDIPEGFADNKEYLKYLTMEGLKKRFEVKGMASSDKTYFDRAEYELSVINSMGYTDYYLIVWDFINYAKIHGIMVGPGRGSGAGSLVAYAIGITDVDPIKYTLVFERFLNSERVSMPDFDVDFCYERRQEVIDYVTSKYGANRVAQVITFGTLAARLCIRDVARVLDLNYQSTDKVAKMIPANPGITIGSAIEANPELKKAYETDADIKKVIDIAMKLEGMPRHASTHAAGVIISGKPITDIAPLSVNDNNAVVQFAKSGIESVGLLKFDFLGLRTLTVLRDTADMVLANYGVKIDFDSISLDDLNVFKMIGDGDTVGIFQLESKGMTSFMKDLKPNSIEDVTAGISLYRPGPMDQIPKYVNGKHDASSITYDHPLLEPILNVTYGCMVYQEQVMQIVRDLAGFSMGQSDNIRRAMSKKKKSMMENYRKLFIYGGIDDTGREIDGAIKRGVPENIADKIFNDVAGFAGYAFNKSHAAAYAIVGYYTAYLKYYYPTEFMAAMLNSFRFNIGACAWYIHCCEVMGIKVLPPDANKSAAKFKTEGINAIRIGLSMIKNVGETAVMELEKERNSGGEFKSFPDFLERCAKAGVKRNMIESLILASALDFTGLSRASMIATVRVEFDKLQSASNRQMDGQMSLFGMDDAYVEQPEIEIISMDEFSSEDLLNYEKEMVGLYLSGHPLDGFRDYIDRLSTFNMLDYREYEDSDRLAELNDDKPVIMCGILQGKRVRTTKSKNTMLVMTVEDLYGQFEASAFGRVFEESSPFLNVNRPYVFVGKRKMYNEDSFSLSVDKIYPLPESGEELLRVMSDYPVKRLISFKNYNDQRVVPASPKADEQTNKQKRKVSCVKITFRNSDADNLLKQTSAFCSFFSGTVPVEVSIEGMNVVLSLKVADNPQVYKKLYMLVGKENINFIYE